MCYKVTELVLEDVIDAKTTVSSVYFLFQVH